MKRDKYSAGEKYKYACLQCLSLIAQGEKVGERTAYLCRNYKYSVDRHKSRSHMGHAEANSKKCIIVPADSKEVKTLKKNTTTREESSITVSVTSSSSQNKPETERDYTHLQEQIGETNYVDHSSISNLN